MNDIEIYAHVSNHRDRLVLFWVIFPEGALYMLGNGEVGVGSVIPDPEIRRICRQNGLWKQVYP